ncbi:hypothetical protein ACE1CD_33045 [Aerosakkonema sp. BLCC-F183]|uniref:hypothetical protein n=1 Tax=Aerosakkonema sp. BLCC-F183 TaxID=3342834 RepID=UPI0035B9DA01
MNQPYLTNCAECERKISSSAYQCPHCQTTSPFGITCHICKNKLRKSRAIEVLDSQGEPLYSAHEGCLNWVKEEVLGNQKIFYQCPVCQTNITISHSTSTPTCPKCGHYFMTNEYYAGRCKLCRNTVLKGFEIKYDYEIYHKLCANKAYPNWEIEEKQRQQKRQEKERNKRQLEEAKAEEARKISLEELGQGIFNFSIALLLGVTILLIGSGISGLVVAAMFGFSSLGKIIGLIVAILVFLTYLLPKK